MFEFRVPVMFITSPGSIIVYHPLYVTLVIDECMKLAIAKCTHEELLIKLCRR